MPEYLLSLQSVEPDTKRTLWKTIYFPCCGDEQASAFVCFGHCRKAVLLLADGCAVCPTLTGLISKSNTRCLEATSVLRLIACVVWDVLFWFIDRRWEEGQVCLVSWQKCEYLSDKISVTSVESIQLKHIWDDKETIEMICD